MKIIGKKVKTFCPYHMEDEKDIEQFIDAETNEIFYMCGEFSWNKDDEKEFLPWWNKQQQQQKSRRL